MSLPVSAVHVLEHYKCCTRNSVHDKAESERVKTCVR